MTLHYLLEKRRNPNTCRHYISWLTIMNSKEGRSILKSYKNIKEPTFIPEISALICPSTEPSSTGRLLRFQLDSAYCCSPGYRCALVLVGKPRNYRLLYTTSQPRLTGGCSLFVGGHNTRSSNTDAYHKYLDMYHF